MRVTLKNGEYSDNGVEQVLLNRGIKKENIHHYLNPESDLMPNYKKLDNIHEGINLLQKHVGSESTKIGLLLDADFDGLTSSGIMYKFLVNHCNVDTSRIISILPKGKRHGIFADELEETLHKGDLLIVPDAGSSDFEQHKILYERGIDVLVVDHHLAPKEDTPAIIINNQLSEQFPNKALTGSAMSYLFCKAYQNENDKPDPVDLLDLSAMGLVADRANFANDLGAYYLMRLGLKKENIKSKLLKKVIEKNGNLEENTDLNAKDIGFNVAPMFNSVFRMGNEDEIEQVLHGICEYDYEIYNKRKKINQHIVEEAYLRAMSVKRRQKKQEDEALEKIEQHIKEKESDKYKVLIVNSTGIITESGLNGLVAMKIVSKYKKPVLMVKLIDDKFKGSGRNLSNSPIESLNELLTDTGYFECKGHANAFGVEFNLSDALNIQEVLEDKLKDVDFNNAEYEVDFIWDNFIDINTIHGLAEQKDMWCYGIDEPLIYVKNVIVRKENFKFIGKTGNTLKLEVQGIDCVKFRISEDEKREIAMSDDTLNLSMVCTASINSFKGRNTPQLLIEEFTLESAKEAIENALTVDNLPF